MTLAAAARAAVGLAPQMTTALGAVQAGTRAFAGFLNSPALQLRPDSRSEMFRASPAELAVGVMNAIDPRRTIFRAQSAELAIGRQDIWQWKALFVRRVA